MTTKEYSRGTPSYGNAARVPFTGTWLLWVRRSTAERPSPPRVCSNLYNNALTGSVPSSLSALTKLAFLCACPLVADGVCACGERGSDGSALLSRSLLRPRGLSGDACRGHRAGAVRQQGLLRYSQRGPRARDVTTDYPRGIPLMGPLGGHPSRAHGCCGCGVVPPSGRVRLGCAATCTTIS